MTDFVDAKLKAKEIEIETNDEQIEHKVNLYTHLNFAQKLNIWLVSIMMIISILSNFFTVTFQLTHNNFCSNETKVSYINRSLI